MKTLLFLVLVSAACRTGFAGEQQFTCEKGNDAFYPSQEDCKAFYHCKDGEAILKLCPSGLEYNPTTQQCELNETAGCQPGVYATSQPETRGSPIIPPPIGIECGTGCRCRYPMKPCHHEYYECVNGLAYKRTCPHPLLYNHKIFNCDRRENMPECYCPIIREPHECTCIRGYTTCCDGERITVNCPSGTAFNNATLSCDRTTFLTSCGSDFDCSTSCHGQKFGVENDCFRYLLCVGNFHLVLHTCPPNTGYNPRTRTCDAHGYLLCTGGVTTPSPPTPCAKRCIHDGEFAHTSHCRRWCHCSNGIGYEKACPGQTHFSEALKRCESPGVAACTLSNKYDP